MRPARGSRGPWPRRLLWALIVVVCATGLRNYRIDNDISRWTEDVVENKAADAFVLIGVERATLDVAAIGERLRALVPDAGVAVLPGAAGMDGVLVAGGDDADGPEMLARVREALGADVDRVALSGPPVFRSALDDWSQRGLPAVSGLIVLIGAFVMAWATRRVRPAIEATVAVFSGQIALVGLISLTGTPMDMVLSMTPPLLMGLGFSFAAHRATRPSVNHALALSVITTAIALATFAFTDCRPIRSFALWGALGIGVTWCGVMLVVSPCRASDRRPAAPMRSGGRWPRWVAGPVVVAALAVTVAGVLLAPGLKLQEDAMSYFPEDARIVRDYRALDRAGLGTLPFEVVVAPPTVDPSAMLRATDGVGLVVPLGVAADGLSATFLGLASSDSVPVLAAAQADWQRWADANGVRMTWGGVAAQVHHIGRAVWRTAMWALPSMLVVAGLAAWLVDRRLSSVILSLWVNAFPVVVISVLLGLSGRPVGLPTLMISALAVGIAIDDTLHILLARRRSGSFRGAVRTCRRACVGSSIAVAACMSAFMLCPFRPTAEFGALVAIAAIAAMIGDMILLPATARWLVRREQA